MIWHVFSELDLYYTYPPQQHLITASRNPDMSNVWNLLRFLTGTADLSTADDRGGFSLTAFGVPAEAPTRTTGACTSFAKLVNPQTTNPTIRINRLPKKVFNTQYSIFNIQYSIFNIQ